MCMQMTDIRPPIPNQIYLGQRTQHFTIGIKPQRSTLQYLQNIIRPLISCEHHCQIGLHYHYFTNVETAF